MTSFDIYTVKESDSIQPLSPQSLFSAVDCFYRDFFAGPICIISNLQTLLRRF